MAATTLIRLAEWTQQRGLKCRMTDLSHAAVARSPRSFCVHSWEVSLAAVRPNGRWSIRKTNLKWNNKIGFKRNCAAFGEIKEDDDDYRTTVKHLCKTLCFMCTRFHELRPTWWTPEIMYWQILGSYWPPVTPNCRTSMVITTIYMCMFSNSFILLLIRHVSVYVTS